MSQSNEPAPTLVRAPEGARIFEVEWDDGQTTLHTHRVLRAYCPCAHCQGEDGPIAWAPGTEDLPDAAFELTEIKEVGRYALSLKWGDGHHTGIYSFRYFRIIAAVDKAPEEERQGFAFDR